MPPGSPVGTANYARIAVQLAIILHPARGVGRIFCEVTSESCTLCTSWMARTVDADDRRVSGSGKMSRCDRWRLSHWAHGRRSRAGRPLHSRTPRPLGQLQGPHPRRSPSSCRTSTTVSSQSCRSPPGVRYCKGCSLRSRTTAARRKCLYRLQASRPSTVPEADPPGGSTSSHVVHR